MADVESRSEDSDFDARFAAIVSGLEPSMDWDTSSATDDRERVASQQREQQERDEREMEMRRLRREQRRIERQRELAEWSAEKASLEAEYNSSDDHFTPPDPPPLPRWRKTTVAAVLLMLVGIGLVAFPQLLNMGQSITLVLGVLLIAAGVAVLVSRLRGSDDDPESGAVL